MSNKKSRTSSGKNTLKGEDGFSLVEAVIAIFILTIGLIGTAAALTYALEYGSISRNVSSAKSIVVASIEEIETLRNSRRLDYKQIANVGAVNNTGSPNRFGGFSTGFKPISMEPGADGVFGTDDDLIDSGADGVFGTADDHEDETKILSGYQRQITITNLSDSLRRVQITVRYFGRAGNQAQISGVSYINDEFRVTR